MKNSGKRAATQRGVKEAGAADVPAVKVRKIVTTIEEIHHEGGPRARVPVRRGATGQNPSDAAVHLKKEGKT